MRILFAIKALDNIKGGAERVLVDIASWLTELGNDVTVLTFDPPGGESFYPLSGKVKRLCLGIGDTQHRATISETIARIGALRRAVKEQNPDIVVPFMHSMFIPMAFALIGTGMPIVASEHIVPDHYKKRRLEFALLLASSFFVDRITVLSEKIKGTYPRFLHKKMVAIANPVREARALSNPEGKADLRKIILSVGRLTPQKDQETLIKAFEKLAAAFPDWDLRIVGEGELRDGLEKLVRKAGLQNQVFLPGATAQIGTEYERAHIFALPSRYESFGLATAEAMAHGLPCLGFSDCAGTNELIVDEETGLLADGGDRVTSFAEALSRLMDSADLRVVLGRKSRLSVQRFQPNIIIGQWNDLLKQTRLKKCRGL